MKIRKVGLVLGISFGLLITNLTATRAITQKKRSFHAATIVYRLTEYGLDGKVVAISDMIRFQHADGRWLNHQVFPDGTTKDSKGIVRFESLIDLNSNWSRAALSQGLKVSEHLGYRSIITPKGASGERGEIWYAPEMDAMVKDVCYDKDGLVLVLEAVEIRDGEPVTPNASS